MNEVLDLVPRVGEDAGGIVPAPEILLRVTVLLLAAMLVSLSLRRSSAALRHLVWAISLTGTLLVPLCYCGLPSWHWAILPPRQKSSSPVAPLAETRPPVPRVNELPPPASEEIALPKLTALSLYQEGRLTDAALESIGKLTRLKSLSLTSYVATQQLGRMRFSVAGIRYLSGAKCR